MRRHLRFIYFLLLFPITESILAQCQVYDGLGVPSANPVWVSCTGGAFNLNFASPTTLNGYTIDWGDGTPPTVGATLNANTIIPHNYPATVDTFIVTLTSTTPACVLTGIVVMEKAVNASIQIPLGGVTTACAPAILQFTNSSTDVSATTTFTWDFGDGSPIQVFDETNAGQTISHTYQQGTVNCQTMVTMTAENYCSFGSPTSAQFNPIQIYDKDDADITPDAFVKCFPDNSFTFTNTTNRNCVPQGNVFQRQELWNFGDYWGLGHDSIRGWTPWPPSFPNSITYPGIGNYNVTLLDSNLCGIDTITITVSIVTPPTAGIGAPITSACAGTSLTFTNSSSPGYVYNWNFGDSPVWTMTGFGSQNHTFPAAGTYTVTVVPFILGASGSCSDTAQIVVTILPNPISSFSFSPSGACDAITVNFTDNSTNAVSWNWNFGNSQTSTLQAPPVQNYSTGNYTVSLQVTAANGCTNTSQQIVRVYQSPVANFSTSNVCALSSTTFTDLSTSSLGDPITTWAWDFGDLGTSTSQNPNHVYSSASSFNVSLSVNTANCSGDTILPITVFPLPVGGFSLSVDNGCGPLLVNFINTSTGAASYNWNFGNGNTSTLINPSETFTNTVTTDTTYYIEMIAVTANGCRDTVIDSVLIYGKPIAGFTFSMPVGCAPVQTSFTNTSQAASTYQWDFGDTQTSTAVNPTHNYQNTTLFVQNFNISLIATNAGGCKDTFTDVITINPEPLFGFNMIPDSGCTQLTVNFPSVAGAVLYEWDFGDGNQSTGFNPIHIYTNSTASAITYTVELIATNAFSCKDTTYGNVVVYPKPSANYTESITIGCSPLNVTFTNTSTNATSYEWDFDDGSPINTQTNPNHLFINSSTSVVQVFNVSLIVTNTFGCKDTITKPITVNPTVTAGFTTLDTIGCEPYQVNLNNTSVGSSTYIWDFDDGNVSAATNPVHIFSNATAGALVYTIEMIATSAFGCKDTAYKSITVFPKPTAQYSQSVNSGCPNLNVNFLDASIGATSFTWDFGDGSATSSAQNPGHLYTNSSVVSSDTSHVMLIAGNAFGCSDTARSTVVVFPTVIANFTADTPICAPVNVVFLNLSLGASTYNWNFGDGNFSSLASPTHSYTNSTSGIINYTVTMTATSSFGCNSSFSHTYAIYPNPQASFIATPQSQLYPATTVNITNTTPFSTFYTNEWSFGDGNTSSAPFPLPISYGTWGSYVINLLVYSLFCRDSVSDTITILPPMPVAAFEGTGSGCRPYTVTFQNNSLYGTSFLWNFGDGNTSNAINPTHTFFNPGIYDITLTVTGDGGVNTIIGIDSVIVYDLPGAAFIATPTTASAGTDVITCTNISQNAISYIWDFGDGSPSEFSTSPQHIFQTPGDYQIMLIAISADGCRDTFIFSPLIKIEEESSISVPNAFSPNLVTGSPDGVYDPASTNNDIFHPVIKGVKTYELSIYSRWGELLFESKDTKVGWDGYYRGKLCTQDVYIWKIKATTIDGKQLNEAGDVLLLRR